MNPIARTILRRLIGKGANMVIDRALGANHGRATRVSEVQTAARRAGQGIRVLRRIGRF